MRIALLSDIHSNLTALDAVLKDAAGRDVAAFWHTGDVVGYGPDPDAVIARLRELPASGVMGNHDAAAVGLISIEEFNPLAAIANEWTARVLAAPGRDYLLALPRTRQDGVFTLLHGSLRDPLWEYLSTREAFDAHFALQKTPVSVCGHTHIPMLVQREDDARLHVTIGEDALVVSFAGRALACINPGGLGQPRDGDPRASYAIVDTGASTVAFHRVAYDIAAVQARMRAGGLPEPLAARLAAGR
ncbi:MAG: metallophosphoesterase family protein [Tepidiformaceae bacterium]